MITPEWEKQRLGERGKEGRWEIPGELAVEYKV